MIAPALYYFSSTALTIALNTETGEQGFSASETCSVSVAAGAAIRVANKLTTQAKRVLNLGYDAQLEYKQYTFDGYNTVLGYPDDKYIASPIFVYIRLDASNNGSTGELIFLPYEVDYDARILDENFDPSTAYADIGIETHEETVGGVTHTYYTLENTNEDNDSGLDNYYIHIATITAPDQGERAWLNIVDCGKLDTAKGNDEKVDSTLEKMFRLSPSNVIELLLPFNKMFFNASGDAFVDRVITTVADNISAFSSWAHEHGLATTASIASYVSARLSQLDDRFFRKDQDDTSPYLATFGDARIQKNLSRSSGTSTGNLQVDNNLTAGGNVSTTGNLSVGGTSTLNGAALLKEHSRIQKSLTFGTSGGNDDYEEGVKGCKIFWNESGWMISTDYLSVNKRMYAKSIQVDEVTHTGAENILTDASCVADGAIPYTEDNGSYVPQSGNAPNVFFRVFFRKKNGEGRVVYNKFRVGDLAYCQVFNIDKGVTQDFSNKYYWREVLSTSNEEVSEWTYGTYDSDNYHYIDLSNINGGYDASGVMRMDADASAYPAADDPIVQLGHIPQQGEDAALVKERQGALILSGGGLNGRAVIMFEGISGFSLPSPQVKLSPGDVKIEANSFSIKTDYGQTYKIPVERGEWSSIPAETGQSDNYHRCYYYDLVQHNGSSWLCTYQPAYSSSPNYTTEEPSSTANNWKVYASKGTNGTNGLSATTLSIPSPLVSIPTDSDGKALSAFDQTYRIGLKIGEETGAFTSYSVSGTPTGVTVSLSPVKVGVVVAAIDVRIQIPKDNTTFPSTLTLSCAGVISDGVSRSVTGTIVLVAQKDGAKGVDGQDGQDGQDGMDGTDGADAVNVMLSPETIILSQGTTSPYSIDLTNAFTVASVNKGTSAESNFTVAVASVSHCTASVDSQNNKKVNITAIATYTQGGKSYYYDNGYVNINITYGGVTYQKRFTFYVNLLGTWKDTVEADTKTAVAQTKYWTYDKDGNPVEQVNIGQFVQSSSQNTSKLESTVGDENGGLVKQTSEISQKVDKISLKVSETKLGNITPDPIFKTSTFTTVNTVTNITSYISTVENTGGTANLVSPWQSDGGRILMIGITANTRSTNFQIYASSRTPSVGRVKLQAGKKYTFTVYMKVVGGDDCIDTRVAVVRMYTAASGGSVSTIAVTPSDKTDEKAGEFEAYSKTFTVESGHEYYEWQPYFYAVKGKSGYYVAYAGAKLEIGEAATGMSYDYTKTVENGLVETGIDITHKKIELTTDNLVCKNNNNEKTMWLDANGTLCLSGNVFTGMTKIESSDDMETCFLHDGSTAVADNETGHTYVYGDGSFYFGTDGRDEWTLTHDVWVPDLFKLTDVNLFTSGNWPSDILLVFPFLIPRDDDTPYSTYDICRTWTTYKTDIGHLMTLDEMYMLAGRRFTIFGNGANIRIVLPRITETTSADGDKYYTLVGYTSFNLHDNRGIAIEYQVLAMKQSNMTYQMTGIVPRCVEIFHATPQIDPQYWEPSE